MHRILVPVDGSAHSLKALAIAGDLALRQHAQIALLHVLALERPSGEMLEFIDPNIIGPRLARSLEAAGKKASRAVPETLLRDMGERILDHALERVRGRAIDAIKLAIETGDPAEVILDIQRRIASTTIVMGCRGGRTATASAFGSVSNTVFQNADCTCVAVK